jgi:signal recognition particle subunit SRP72
MELLNRIKRDFSQAADESSDFNEVKNLNLNLTICQTALDGFDHSKVSRITESYETFFNSGKFQELFPYFYNNFLNIKKDKEPINDILRKLDNILKNENLMQEERDIVLLNKTILLLRANRIAEASEIYKNMNPDANSTSNNPLRTIVYCYIYLKQEKAEKYDEFVKSDISIKNKPESHLILIQIMLSSLTSKNMEQFHLKVLNFIKEFFEYTINFHFLNFFIGFYESRHLKDYLKEFVRNYKDTSLVYKSLISKRKEKDLKKCFMLLGRSLYTVGLYEESSSYFSYLLENVDKYDVLLKIELINSIAHLNAMKSEEIRRQVDDTMIDMSLDHFNVLVSEVFVKSKKNQGGDKKKSKKNKKKRFPKNFDPKKPGPMPDVERWLPRMQRKKFRNIAKNKLAYQGATADNTVTSSQFGKK